MSNYLRAAQEQLPAEDFSAITSALPFPQGCVEHFLTISQDPRFTKRNRWSLFSATAVGLRAMAEMIEAPAESVEVSDMLSPDAGRSASASAERSADLDAAEAREVSAEPPTAAAMEPAVANDTPAEASVRRVTVSVAKFKEITGLSFDRFNHLASLPPEEFKAERAT